MCPHTVDKNRCQCSSWEKTSLSHSQGLERGIGPTRCDCVISLGRAALCQPGSASPGPARGQGQMALLPAGPCALDPASKHKKLWQLHGITCAWLGEGKVPEV